MTHLPWPSLVPICLVKPMISLEIDFPLCCHESTFSFTVMKWRSCRWFSHIKVIIQNQNLGAMRYVYGFDVLAHLQSSIGQFDSVDLSIISCAATLIGRPEYSVSLVLVRPQRISINYFFVIEIDGSESL